MLERWSVHCITQEGRVTPWNFWWGCVAWFPHQPHFSPKYVIFWYPFSYLASDFKMQKNVSDLYLISDQNSSKTVLFGFAHIYLLSLYQGVPLPPPPPLLHSGETADSVKVERNSSAILYPESSGSLASGWSPGDSEELEFYYCRISAVERCNLLESSQSKNLIFFWIPQSLSRQPTAGQRAWRLWLRDWPMSYPYSNQMIWLISF